MSKEETEIDEAMFPGTKEYEKKFGQSPQQKLKKKGDTVPTSQGDMTKTDKGIAHRRRFTEMLESYTEGGLKYIATLVQEEPDNEEYTKEVEDQKAKMDGKKKGGDVAKASVQAVKNEEVEELDELSKSTLASYAKKASHEARMKHGIGKDFERISKSSRKPEYKQGAKEWEDKYKSDARRREAGVGKAIDRLAKEETEIQVINADIANGVEQIDIEEGAKETATRARELADKLSKKDPKKSQFYRNMANQALTRINKGVGIGSYRPGDIEGGGNKSLRRQGIEPAGKSPVFPFRKEEVEIEERSLTEPEMKKKEEIVMSMKKKMPGFKERYGDRAKEVMYATATKMAKKD
jgi:hypothetical protein